MKTVTVNTASSYDVFVGSDLMKRLPDFLSTEEHGQKAVIISDSNVWPIYGDLIENQLNVIGFSASHYVFPAGEEQKTARTYLAVVEYLAKLHFTRSDMLIALGGGVVGDLTGFVAATFLRGVSYIQIPTSLLAMVDSSVGGKTAIDLSAGKNLIGAFYQPSMVICDISALSTLPKDVFRDGCAEVIKYGILYDKELFSHLEKYGLNFDAEYVISRCIALKRDVVTADEFDRGERQKLNLGHTIGHGIEACSDFQVSHGYAVAMGTAVIVRYAEIMGYCSKDTVTRILNIIRNFGFSVEIPYSSDKICAFVLSDKKRNGSTVNFIIPEYIGKCSIVPVSVEKIPYIIQAGL